MYERLAPRDPIIRHAWLSASHWVQGSDDEIEDGDLDVEKRAAWIHKRRTEAMTEIRDAHGLEGAVAPLADSDALGVIGRYAASNAKEHAAATEVLRTCLSNMTVPAPRIDGLMTGFIESLDGSVRPATLSAAAEGMASDQSDAARSGLSHGLPTPHPRMDRGSPCVPPCSSRSWSV